MIVQEPNQSTKDIETDPLAPSDACDPSPVTVVLLVPAPLASPDGQVLVNHLNTVAQQVSVYTGFPPTILPVEWEINDARPLADDYVTSLMSSLCELADNSRVFLLPAVLDFTILHQQALSELTSILRKELPVLAIHYDDPDPTHPVAAQGWSTHCQEQLQAIGGPASDLALVLFSSGSGTAESRAKAHALMRLLWESSGASHGAVAFVRHETHHLLPAINNLPDTVQRVLVVPQAIVTEPWLAMGGDALNAAVSEMPQLRFLPVKPWAFHESIRLWLVDRIVRLWREHQNKMHAHIPSALHSPVIERNTLLTPCGSRSLCADSAPHWGHAHVARIYDPPGLRALLAPLVKPDRPSFVKVTWHGYATGTFTDARALDVLLDALPGPAIVMEGHTSSRNLGGAEWDWETEAEEHRRWIWEQDAEFRKRTGIQDVLEKHRAQYLNVTETYWDGACADKVKVLDLISEKGVVLNNQEIAAFVPQVIWDNRGANFISFARFKGSTRLSISNCFGLLPDTLRARWHGPNLTYMARICCDIVQLYGVLLNGVAVVEALHAAVRWDRQGLYRSRWGNYDIVPDPALVVASSAFGDCDAIACRLQGHDPERSAFFDVVREELGIQDTVNTTHIPPEAAAILT